MNKKLIGLLTIGFVLFFIVFVVDTANELSKARVKILQSPNITDVTHLLSTRLLVSSEDLPADGEWSKKGFDDSSWEEIRIPSNELLKDKNYALNRYAYYRIRVPKVAFDKLTHLKNEVSLALQFVLFDTADITINGNLFRTSTPKSEIEYIQIIPVPDGGDTIVGIKGYIRTPADNGINHRNEILLGKTGELNELFLAAYKRQTTYQLVFILCKGSILFIFALIFLLLEVDSSFSKFFLFGICTMIEELISGLYLDPYLSYEYQVFLYNYANVGATLFVFMFFAELLSIEINRKKLLAFAIGLSVVSGFIAVDVIHKNYLFDVSQWMRFWNVMMVIVMTYFVPRVFKADKILFCVLVVTIGLYLWGVAPSSNIGLNFKRYGNVLLFVMVAYQTFVIFSREQKLLRLKDRQLLEQEKDVVMGKTASLLAHDVRKPLDQMKLVFDKISAGEVDKEFIELAKKDIDYSIESVTQQINDMMNFGKTSEVILRESSFYKVLSHGIKQVMSIHQEMDLKLEYSLNAKEKILGDETRLSGIVVNLVANAVEAIRDIGNSYSGKIKFSTELVEEFFVFKIFNDGPEIPEALVKDIFKPLFTHGKAKGTGLGLASVAKAVNDHQGKIEVKNIEGEGVEFTVELRAASEIDSYDMSKFLSSSKDYDYKMTKITELGEKADLRVLVLGSHSVRIKDLIEKLPYKTSISFASDLKVARELIQKMRFDLYLLNKDLGGEALATSELSYLDSEVVLYTNEEDLSNLEKICLDIYPKRKRILLVDDTKLFQVAWQMFHGKHNIDCVASPEEALQIVTNPSKEYDAYVLDFHFTNSSLDGATLAKKIRDYKSKAQIFISSSIEQEVTGFQSISKKDYEVRKYLV